MSEYTPIEAKRRAEKHLATMKAKIRAEKPFCLRFSCAGYDWQAYAPQVFTAPLGGDFVLCHQLVGKRRMVDMDDDCKHTEIRPVDAE